MRKMKDLESSILKEYTKLNQILPIGVRDLSSNKNNDRLYEKNLRESERMVRN